MFFSDITPLRTSDYKFKKCDAPYYIQLRHFYLTAYAVEVKREKKLNWQMRNCLHQTAEFQSLLMSAYNDPLFLLFIWIFYNKLLAESNLILSKRGGTQFQGR